jgi:hypothetical protein
MTTKKVGRKMTFAELTRKYGVNGIPKWMFDRNMSPDEIDEMMQLRQLATGDEIEAAAATEVFEAVCSYGHELTVHAKEDDEASFVINYRGHDLYVMVKKANA